MGLAMTHLVGSHSGLLSGEGRGLHRASFGVIPGHHWRLVNLQALSGSPPWARARSPGVGPGTGVSLDVDLDIVKMTIRLSRCLYCRF